MKRSGMVVYSFLPGNRSLVVFMICLAIATILWFLNALSKNYTTTISHPVEFVDLPKNKFIVNHPPEKLNLKIYGHGFALLRYQIGTSFSPLLLNVTELVSENPPVSAGLYVIPTNNIKNHISIQLDPELQLVDITPGVFTLNFDSLGVKQVPVALKANLGFKPRFGLSSAIEFTPSRVTITGPRNIIEKTDTIYTVAKVYKNLEATFSQDIALEIPAQMIVEPVKVLITAHIDEYTEKSMSVPVRIDNQPDNLKIRFFPQEVEVSFRIGLSRYSQIKPEEISLTVSWDDIIQKQQELRVKIKKLPPFVTSVNINPENVEYLIEKN